MSSVKYKLFFYRVGRRGASVFTPHYGAFLGQKDVSYYSGGDFPLHNIYSGQTLSLLSLMFWGSLTLHTLLPMNFVCPCRENVMEDIHSKLQEIRNPIHAIGVLIREMDYETELEMERGDRRAAFSVWLEGGSGLRVAVDLASILFLSFSSAPQCANEPLSALWQWHSSERGVPGCVQDCHRPLSNLPRLIDSTAAVAEARGCCEYGRESYDP